jgi:phage shock protein PspC (stress-responsive transcriptional regulator)
MEKKKLTRSLDDRMVGGVCGGLGQYLDIDPTVIRLVFVLLALLAGNGILIYLVMLLLIPAEQTTSSHTNLE